MRFARPRVQALATVALLALSLPLEARAGERLTVHLQSGRSFTAHVDEKTDGEQLWLRFENGAMTVWRPIDWQRVRGGVVDGRTLDAASLRQAAVQIKSKASSIEVLPAPAPETTAPTAVIPAQPAAILDRTGAEPNVARALHLEATIANWDADVEVDGLVVTASALDGHGRLAPVDGHLTIELIGTRPAAFRSKYAYSRGAPFPQLGNWTRQIDTFGLATPIAQFQLPFQAQHPSFDADLGSHGVVHARLVVPGKGVFEASADLVRIRPFSPIRDRLQQFEGRRFFAIEQLGRTQ